jgi:zinc/manganese transport system substrate-binding protein
MIRFTQRIVIAPAARAAACGPIAGLFTALCAALFALAPAARAGGKPLQVVTTTEDLASIAREVGGDRVQVASLSHGYQDPHFVDAKPSYMVTLSHADLFVEVGRELEVGWAPGLVNGSRNPRILPGAPGHVDASSEVQVIEVPAQVSRAQGDVHPFGNPHYWLDPANAAPVAHAIRDGLIRISPGDAELFNARTADFEKRLAAAIERWNAQAKTLGLEGMKVVTYHRSWSYFAKAYGLVVVDYIEPRPGIPPSPNHLQDLITEMKSNAVRVLIMEPYFDTRIAEKVCRDTHVPLAVLPSSVGGEDGVKTYFDLFDRMFADLAKAMKAGS